MRKVTLLAAAMFAAALFTSNVTTSTVANAQAADPNASTHKFLQDAANPYMATQPAPAPKAMKHHKKKAKKKM